MNDELSRDLIEKIATLNGRVEALSTQMTEVRQDVGEMKKWADRYRGAFLFILALGGTAGWFFDLWDRIAGHRIQ